MRRLGTALPILVLSVALLSPAAFAKGKFIDGNATVTDGEFRTLNLTQSAEPIHGGLFVTFTEVGLGANAGTNYLVTADASATYVCVNNGGNQPSAENKETVSGPVSATGTFTSGANGRVEGSLPVPPLGPGSFTCPGGQTVFLYSVSYTNVVITDTTNGVSLTLPGPFTRTF